MKTYRNERHGFEVGIPEKWSVYTESHTVDGTVLIFKCGSNEAFNIQITPLPVTPFPYQVENEFRQLGEKKGLTSLMLGRFTADGKEHIWARFYMGYGQWQKKYRIILHGFDYVLTTTCLDQKFLLEMEKDWDEIASSFCLIKDKADSTIETPAQTLETHVEAAKEVLWNAPVEGVKTYKNEEFGIEIDIPAGWTLPAKDPFLTQAGAEIIFGCERNEAFYITIKEATTKLSGEQMELKFREYALDKGYSKLEFGKFVLANEEFVWVKYFMGDNVWVKKYFVFLNTVHYEITASRTEASGNRSLFDQKCKDWDRVVSSCRILHPSIGDIFRDKPISQIFGQPAIHPMNASREDEPERSNAGMKTYRNEKHGFAIDIPESWSFDSESTVFHPLGGDYSLVFRCDPGEAFNIQVGPLGKESTLEATRREFTRHARRSGYSDLTFGRITVENKDHLWAGYQMGPGAWMKKYMIVLNGFEYAITATCFDHNSLPKREDGWDKVVKSFHIIQISSFDLSKTMQILAMPARLSEIPKRIELCQQALEHVDRQTDPETWAGLEIELAKNLGQNPQGDRAENIEQAILHNQKALEVFTREAYPEYWANIHTNLASNYRNRIRGNRAENIEQAIDCCKQALDVLDPRTSSMLWASAHNNLANVYRDRVHGERADNIEQAIEHCRQTLEVLNRDAHPFQWATVQNNLGNAYQDRILGERELNDEQAIFCYQQALEVFTRETYPEDWAWTHCNLGKSYHGRIRGDKTENIESSIQHSQQALEVFTKEALPEKWALTHVNLGNAHLIRRSGKKAEDLKQTIAHYQLAMSVFTQQAYPERWDDLQSAIAMANQQLSGDKRFEGLDLSVLHDKQLPDASMRRTNPEAWAHLHMFQAMSYGNEKHGERAENLEKVMYHLQQALEVFTRHDYPEDWAMAQIDLGEAYRHLSLIRDLDDNLSQAISFYELALEVATRTAYPELWAAAHNNLGIAYANGMRGDISGNVEKAISHCQQALEIYTRESHPDDWAMTQNNLGGAYRKRINGDRAENIEKAISCFQRALEVQDHQPDREQWAGTHNNLSMAYWERLRGDRAENLEKVIFHLQRALEVYTLESHPHDWASMQHKLGATYEARIRGDHTENLEKSIHHIELALKVTSPQTDPENWAKGQTILGLAYQGRKPGDRAENIEKAISCFSNALQVFTIQAFPADWAVTQFYLAYAYQDRVRGDRAENMECSIGYFQRSLEVLTCETHSDQWASTHNCLAMAYMKRQKGDRSENYDQAIQHCQEQLKVYTRLSHPERWAMAQFFLGTIMLDRKQGTKDEYTEQALHYYQQALEVFTPYEYPEHWAQVQGGIALVDKERGLDGTEIKDDSVINKHPELTYPDFYNKESRRHPDKKCHLKLIYADAPDIKYATSLLLVYQWEDELSDEQAEKLRLRAVAYLTCAIYDAAHSAGVPCMSSPIPNGQRPAWIIQGEKSSVSLTLSDMDQSDRTLQMSVGPMMVALNNLPVNKTYLKKLMEGFREKFGEINV